MDHTRIIGTIEICASMAATITGDARPHSGMGKYEKKEFFVSLKASCRPEDADEVYIELWEKAESGILGHVDFHSDFTANKRFLETNAAEVLSKTSDATPAPPPQPEAYHVVEAPAPIAQPDPQPDPQPETHKDVAERLKRLGMSKDNIVDSVNAFFDQRTPRKYTPAEYLEAFRATEAFIRENSLEQFRSGLAAWKTPPGDNDALATIRKNIGAKWPSWSPDLVAIASLWCRDQVTDVGHLEAFLAAAAITTTTPPGKIEAYLAITRHMAISAGAKVVEYCKRSHNPMSMIESDLGKAVSADLRTSGTIPGNAVYDAFEKMCNALTPRT